MTEDDSEFEVQKKRLGTTGRRKTLSAKLSERVQRRQQEHLIGLFGTVDYDPTHNYKRERAKRR